MFKVVTLFALIALTTAAPFWWERDFFLGLYEGYTGSSGDFYYKCLPDSQQYSIQEAILKISKDYHADKSVMTIIEDIFAVSEDFWDMLEECKIMTIPDALLATILKEGPMFLFKFLMNMEKISEDFYNFFENWEKEPETAGKYLGDMFKQFIN
jgi:hypothetical protein